MELTNEFEVSVPVEQAWAVLTDVERIAPCLPGAQLQEVEGDEYRGIVKVKVGPITAQYKGKATFVERDADAHKAVLQATGRDTRGQGNASATILAQLTPAGEGTHVSVTTDLTVTGKVAQFGRGVLGDVSAKLLAQFVENLEKTVLIDVPGSAEAAVVAEAEAVVEAAAEGAGAGGAGDEAAAGSGEPGAGAGAGATTTSAAEEAGIVDQQGAALAAEERSSDRPGERSEASADAAPSDAAPSGSSGAGADPAVVASDEDAAGIVDQQAAVAAEQAEGGHAAASTEAAAPASSAGGVRRIDSPEVPPIDLLEQAGSPVLKRLLPLVGLSVVAVVLWRLVRRRG